MGQKSQPANETFKTMQSSKWSMMFLRLFSVNHMKKTGLGYFSFIKDYTWHNILLFICDFLRAALTNSDLKFEPHGREGGSEAAAFIAESFSASPTVMLKLRCQEEWDWPEELYSMRRRFFDIF